jgi:hypothetical protein
MPGTKPIHRSDPRTLSEKHPGRSKIRDEAPSLTPLDFSSKKDQEQKERVVTDPAPDRADLERRQARRRSAMPHGTKGSRKGAPPGARKDPEGQSS